MSPPSDFPPPSDPLDSSERGPYQQLAMSRGSVVALATVSYVGILVLFALFAQRVQILNLPFGLILSSLLLFGAAGLFFPALLGQSPGRFTGLSRFPLKLVGLGFVIGAVNLPFANFLMGVMREVMPEPLVHAADEVTKILVRADSTTRVLLVIGAGVAAPLGEELFFRGWMQRILVQRFSLVASALSVAFAFSLIHLDPVGFIARVELGLLFGLVSAWSRSLWAGIAMHAAHNLISTAALYFATDDPLKELEEPFDWKQASVMALLGLAATVALVRYFRHLAREEPAPEPEPLVRPRISLLPALQVAAATAFLVVASVAFLWQQRDVLPGQELTRALRLQIFRLSDPVHPVNPK